jgi:hypothetical protein
MAVTGGRWSWMVAVATACALVAGCGSDDDTGGATTVAAPSSTRAATIAATASPATTSAVEATTVAPVLTTPPTTAAPATTAAGGFEAITGLWFFECEEYIPGDGATSGVFTIEQTGPEQITIDVQGYRYTTPDCSDEPTPDAANVLVFEVVGVTEGPNGAEYAVTDATGGFSDTFSLGGDGVLLVDGDPMTRTVDFNTAYD